MKSLDVITIGRSSVDLYGAQIGGRPQRAHVMPINWRTTAASSNGKVSVPIVCPCS